MTTQQNNEWGDIPQGWEVVALGDIGEPIIGLTYSPNDIDNLGTLVLRSSNIQNNKLAFDDNVYVNTKIPERVFVRENDILICVRNGSRQLIGKCALIDKKTEGSAFGAFMSVLRTPFAPFVFYAFQSNVIQNQINEVMGATINQITNKDLSNFQIPIPKSLTEQSAIATVLSDTDKWIDSLTALIAKKQAIKSATMSQLLSGQKRLSEFANHSDGTPKTYIQTDNGKIPEDWEIVALGDVCHSFKTGKLDANAMIDNGAYPFFTCAKKIYRIDTYAFDVEALLISGNGANVGYIHYYNGKFNAYQRTYVLSDFSKNIIFIKYYLEKELSNRIEIEMRSGNTPYITMDTLTDMMILVPKSLTEQTAIAKILSDMDSEIIALENRLNKTKALKQGLMHQLLTGKIRLI